jgi:hypothetical protein
LTVNLYRPPPLACSNINHHIFWGVDGENPLWAVGIELVVVGPEERLIAAALRFLTVSRSQQFLFGCFRQGFRQYQIRSTVYRDSSRVLESPMEYTLSIIMYLYLYTNMTRDLFS